eukprot:362063-Chlamydomonas_euryale.AAC.3
MRTAVLAWWKVVDKANRLKPSGGRAGEAAGERIRPPRHCCERAGGPAPRCRDGKDDDNDDDKNGNPCMGTGKLHSAAAPH